jgi:hypothetical protein
MNCQTNAYNVYVIIHRLVIIKELIKTATVRRREEEDREKEGGKGLGSKFGRD